MVNANASFLGFGCGTLPQLSAAYLDEAFS